LFNFFKQQQNTTCIDYIKGEEIDPGLNLRHTLEYFCQLLGTSLERALDYIKTMGIHDLNKTKKTPEAVKKIYFAACLASDKDIVVIKDFIKQE
ncbi:MAG: hypothetical protein GTN82_43330, partial [Candidatus Aminicenantes bacterium]|nr:hypothetical protein [Candidatus Aminicenantes bacterium]